MAARPPKGEVIRNPTREGFKFALRFTAAGKRYYVTLGTPDEGWTPRKAEDELLNVRPAAKKRPGVGAVRVANRRLEAEGLSLLPDGLTLHALRRMYASLLFSIGRPAPYVMAQMGHTDPAMTPGLYAKVMSTTEADQDRLGQLVNGDYLAVAGSGSDPEPTTAPAKAEGTTAEVAH